MKMNERDRRKYPLSYKNTEQNKDEDKKKDKYTEIVVALTVGLLPMLISDMIPEKTYRNVFIICIMVSAVTFTGFRSRKEKWKKGVPVACAVVAGLILLRSLFGTETGPEDLAGTGNESEMSDIGEEADGSGQQEEAEGTEPQEEKEADQQGKEETGLQETEAAGQQGNEQSIYAASCETIATANEQIADLIRQREEGSLSGQELGEAQTVILRLAEEMNQERFWESRRDEKEAEKALQYIKESWETVEEKDRAAFNDLGTDRKQVELFYKIKISEGNYFYCNMIRAMEDYGIDCEGMSIDEHVLFGWDVDRLFALYDMRKGMESKLTEEELIEEWAEDYNDHRASVSGSSDVFDYGGWNRNYKDRNVRYIVNDLERTLVNYFTKFHKNFGTTAA